MTTHFRKYLWLLVAATAPLCLRAEKHRGKFTPHAQHVLSGQLARDLPPLPEVPFRLMGAEDGFRAERISEVHTVGGQAMAEKQWSHFAVTYGDFVRVYVDGKLIDSRMVDRSAFHSPTTDARAESITFMDGEDGGVIDSLRIWNRILSADEIARMSNHD